MWDRLKGLLMRRSGVRFVEYSARAALLFGALIGAVMLVSLPGLSLPVMAEQARLPSKPNREVLIGTVDVPAVAPKAVPQSLATASDYYSQALQALEAGNVPSAERLFERTIEADPNGTHAGDARRHLGQLYSAAGVPGGTVAGPPRTVDQQLTPADSNLRKADSSASDETDDGPSRFVPGHRQRPQASDEQEQLLTEAGDRVFFSAGSAELGSRAREVLAAQAVWLSKRTEWNVTIEGHADDPSLSEQELEDISEARARAVKDRLISEGIAAKRLSVVPWGRSAPISACSEAGCQAQNRRAITVLTPRRGPGQRDLSQQIGPKRLGASGPLAASRSDPAAR